jgi:predicted dehydrogenase
MAKEETKPIRFGILGCAEIARKVSRAINLSPNGTLYAIGSRSYEKAKTFAASNNFPSHAKIYGSYDAVLDDPNVDAVYVPLPTSLHLRWAVLAAQKKKHLLLEKPVALNVGELDKILEACEANGLQYMDATMWMHHPRTEKMFQFLSDPNQFGSLQSVHATFSYRGSPHFLENDIRVKPDLDALGTLGDTGWYCIRAILWAANYELPIIAKALHKPKYNKAGVILSLKLLCYGKITELQLSFVPFYQTWLWI